MERLARIACLSIASWFLAGAASAQAPAASILVFPRVVVKQGGG